MQVQAFEVEPPLQIESILTELRGRVSNARRSNAERLARRFLQRVGEDELASRTPAAWTALILGLLEFIDVRTATQTKVRVFNPSIDECGWDAPHTIVEVVTEDSPFLVDSVALAIAAQGSMLRAVIHPILALERDPGGHLLGVHDGLPDSPQRSAESLMHFEVDLLAEPTELLALKQAVEASLHDVRASVRDWPAMRDAAVRAADFLRDHAAPVDDGAKLEAEAFMRWVADNHFTFLGYREYEVTKISGVESLRAVDGSGLGVLKSSAPPPPRPLSTLPGRAAGERDLRDAIIVTKTNARSTVHRPGYMDYISVLRFDAEGRAVGEFRFLGLFTSGAYARRPWDVPWVRHKYEAVMARSGFRRDSHSGKALRHVLETLPRDELYQGSADQLFATAMAIMALAQRQRVRVLLRADAYARFFSVLVFVPRDRFNEDVRQRIEALFKSEFSAEHVDTSVHVAASPLARLHLVMRVASAQADTVDCAALERKITEIVRNWHDALRDLLLARHGEERGLRLASRFGRALPAGYIEAVTPEVAASDVETAASLRDADELRLSFSGVHRASGEGSVRLKLFRFGSHLPLSDVLPMMENMGLRVLAEHPYEMKLAGGGNIFIQDLEVDPGSAKIDAATTTDAFQQAFGRTWRGECENDGFNRLVLRAQLGWRQISLLRAYAKYLLQMGVPFSQQAMEATLSRYPLHARLLVELFEAAFDPAREAQAGGAETPSHRRFVEQIDALSQAHGKLPEKLAESLAAPGDGSRAAQIKAAQRALSALMDEVQSLDEDRILRSYQTLIAATLRTNYFQADERGAQPYLAFKLDPQQILELPKPRPYREIFVCGPRVEGVHMRFGPVARGGLRWSDRREDFRTEVLGLVKAQMVKNTVIVPVGAKGGFIVKRPPADPAREIQLAEGVACYRMFIRGLLDITDNIVDDAIVKPERVVCRDGDDPYLVVAADKGTATFSDIANSVSAEFGFWMGDAFASGGSKGYDHKSMGITAKGGWESVKRHFRALGRDCQREDFSCVGIGDMSGDVFGNGMLLSRHIGLVAAFDHRHIFIDPAPDPGSSFAERERLFKLPRSSWDDYDRGLISAGGGVWPRSAKSISLSPAALEALGLDDESATISPPALISAILTAPVDLLWNGGIGTYVKSAAESHVDVGDRANNAIRIDAGDLRCRIVGEGGNLGFTQLGRIVAAQAGVLLNTDFIDNSAGVDTSDHEVNIKILLGDIQARGEIDEDRRVAMLKQMTDEVEGLVLRDNYLQNQAISLMQRMSRERIGAEQHFVRVLEAQNLLDRDIEFLPSEAQFAERKARGLGLTRPELAILLSYSKLVLFQQLLQADVPEDPFLSRELARYFPQLLQPYAQAMERHRLKREIVATAVTNSMVNRMGATFVMRMQEDTGEAPGQIARAYAIAREVLDARRLWARIEALDGSVHDDAQMDAMGLVWQLLRHATRWLLNAPGQRRDIARAVQRYAPGVGEIRAAIAHWAAPTDVNSAAAEKARWIGLGFPADLALDLGFLPVLTSVFDIIEVAHETGHPLQQTARIHFALGEALHLKWLMQHVELLAVAGRWHAQARGTMRDELYTQQRALVTQVLKHASAGSGPIEAVASWLGRDEPTLKFTLAMLADMRGQAQMDYPTVSVAVRRLAQLALSGTRGQSA